jgi:hypothetical protein
MWASGGRSASPVKRALKMVPLDALHAAERARDGIEGEKAALQVHHATSVPCMDCAVWVLATCNVQLQRAIATFIMPSSNRTYSVTPASD